MVKCLPTMRETWVQSLGREDLLEKEMATCNGTSEREEFEQALGVSDGQGSLACCIPWGHKETLLGD